MEGQWRQGAILKEETAHSLGLDLAKGHRAVVISHDCDVARSEKVEVIIARHMGPDCNPQYLRGCHVRMLHLCYETQAIPSSFFYLELIQTERAWLKGEALRQCRPDPIGVLSPAEKNRLKQWLAAYYGRSAFPDAFEERIRHQNLHVKLQKILEKSKDLILSVFFDLNGDQDRELPSDSPYSLSIWIVFEDGPASEDDQEARVAEVEGLFGKIYPDEGAPDIILLDQCHAVTASNFSFADYTKMQQWRLEHVSLRQDPPGPYSPHGK